MKRKINLLLVLFYLLAFLENTFVDAKARGANDGLGKGGSAAAHIKLTPADKAAAVELKDPKAPIYVVVLVFCSPCILGVFAFGIICLKDKFKSEEKPIMDGLL